MNRVVNLGEYFVSADESVYIHTYGLATCVGVVVYSNKSKLMAMAHVVLPGMPPTQVVMRSERRKYAGVLIPEMFHRIEHIQRNLYKDSLKVSLYGGIEAKDGCVFRIGERNLISVCEELEKLNIPYDMTNTRGNVYRTLVGSVKTGNVDVKNGVMRE